MISFPKDARARPQVALQDIAGMRNELIHDYLRVFLEIVWQTASEDLPKLKHQTQTIFKDKEKGL